MRIIKIALTLLLLLPSSLWASPRLAFTDLVSGPDTGIGDGLGSGAIITVWGWDLGASQGSSKIYYKDSTETAREAAYVYYWCNADGVSGGGPSDLYTSHGMQEIAFSIPDSATGAGTIYVTTSSGTSNSLPFTVRAGNIYHAKTTGNDTTGDGSWGNPYRTLNSMCGRGTHTMSAGDIAYGGDGLSEAYSATVALDLHALTGTADNPISIVAYPGATVTCSGSSAGVFNKDYSTSVYVNVSKITAASDISGIVTSKGGRTVGCAVTDITYASGTAGAIWGSCLTGDDRIGGSKALGNYIHDWGSSSTSQYAHTTYYHIRALMTVEGFTFAFNHLTDNYARFGIHYYDENGSGTDVGSFSTPCYIYSNYVKNQGGSGINVGCNEADTDEAATGDFYIYNNILINCGLVTGMGTGCNPQAIHIYGRDNEFDIYFYNNTIYGYGESGNASSAAIMVEDDSENYGFNGTWTYKNNIVVDTKDLNYTYGTIKSPTASSNNLWYNGGDSTPASAPAWDTSPLTTDPSFTNAASGDFTLSSTSSPCYDAGADLSGTFTTDFVGVTRSSWDIGAFEYEASTPPSTPSLHGVSLHGVDMH